MRILVGLFIALFSVTVSADPVSSVTIPIQDYLDLTKKNEKPNVTTIEEIQVTGEFKKNLKLTISTASIGNPEFRKFLQDSANFSLSSCTGGSLLKSESDYFQILPKEGRNKTVCEIIPKSWGEIHMSFTNAMVLNVSVKGVDPIINDQGVAQRSVSFQAAISTRSIASNEVVEPSAQGRYHISVQPEETKFEYFISFNNPNRTAKSFELKLPNDEIVQKVKTELQYEDKKGTLIFKLNPGESQVSLTGRLPKPDFKPLITKGINYLLLDNHPLLTLNVNSQARRVAVSDTGMRAWFAGARGFLTDKEETLAWTSKKLEVFSALSYAVNSTDYTYYWSGQGSSLVEATFNIDNQGTPEIPLKIPGTATYLEVNGVPQVLSKDDQGQLLLRLPNSKSNNIFVQYQTEKRSGRFIASVQEDLARPTSIMSNVNVNVRVPNDQSYIYASSLGDSHWTMGFFNIVLALSMFIIFSKIFESMGLRPITRIFGSIPVAIFIFQKPWYLPTVLLAVAILFAVRHRVTIKEKMFSNWKGWVAATTGLASLIIAFNLVSPSFQRSQYREDASYGAVMAKKSLAAPAYEMNMDKGRAAPGALGSGGGGYAEGDVAEYEQAALPEETVAASTDEYQGLPAKIQMPDDGYNVNFSAGLLDNSSPINFFVLSVHNQWIGYLTWMMALMFGWTVWQSRQSMRAFLKV